MYIDIYTDELYDSQKDDSREPLSCMVFLLHEVIL